MEKELRVYDNEVEVRQLDDGTEVISGYAVVFNSESRDLGGFIETIAPTAFNEADMTDVLALFNHDNNLVLGRTPTTLTLSIDQKGVRYDIKPPDTTVANDLKKSIARGDVRGSSFGFTIHKDGDVWEKPKERGGAYRRMVTRIKKLWDVSPVVTPAYVATDTTIARRELGILKDREEVEASQKMQQVDEIEALKLKRQSQQMDIDLAYHETFEKILQVKEREYEKKRKGQLRKFDADFKLTNKDTFKILDDIKMEE